MTDAVERPRGVSAAALRRIGFWTALAGVVTAAVLDRRSGDDAVLNAVPALLLYLGFVVMPLRLLYRDVRLRASGFVVFALALIAIVSTAWCIPAPIQFADGYQATVAVREALGNGDIVGSAAASRWQFASIVSAGVAVVCSLVLCADVWSLQRRTRGHAVNPLMVGSGSLLATVATTRSDDYFGRASGM